MKKGNYERAKKTITKVLKIDTNNPLAKRYLIELNTATELKITDTNLNKNKQNVFRDYEKGLKKDTAIEISEDLSAGEEKKADIAFTM